MKLFDFSDYREFFDKKCEVMPKKGHGQLRRMSIAMGVHTTTLSQIFAGTKSMTLEMAIPFAEYWKLSPAETKYLTVLIQIERAGSSALKKLFREQAEEMRRAGQDRKQRVAGAHKMSEAEKSKFYSNWYYSGVRLLTSVPGHHTVDAIARRLALRPELVAEVVDFLLEAGLIAQGEGGLRLGPTHTHIEASSPHARSQHINWRLKAAEHYERLDSADFVFTGPLTVSFADRRKIRQILVHALDQVSELVEKSEPETLCCFGMDCVEIRPPRM